VVSRTRLGLNVAKSQFSPGPPPQSLTVKASPRPPGHARQRPQLRGEPSGSTSDPTGRKLGATVPGARTFWKSYARCNLDSLGGHGDPRGP